MNNLTPFRVIQVSGEHGTTTADRIHPVVLSLIFGALGVCASIVVTAIEGSLGSTSDFQPVADARRIANVAEIPGSTEFPLLRDVATWAMAMIIFLTVGVVWRQWQLFSSCLGDLANNRVLKERGRPEFNMPRRLLGYERMANYKGKTGLEGFTNRMNHWLESWGRLWVLLLMVFGSFALALALLQSYNSVGIFRLWNVDGSTLSDGEFANSAYDGWWASHHHLGGYIVYLTIAAIGVLAILLQNVVGAIAVYVIGGFPAFCEFDVDWFDQDGNYGWGPLGQVFRTVRWSLLMHAVALMLLFALVGVGVWPYAALLLALWAGVFPIYLGIPSLMMRSVGPNAKRAALVGAAIDPEDIGRASTIVPYVRRASIKPLRLSRFGVYAFFASILLPTILTIAQIVGSK